MIDNIPLDPAELSDAWDLLSPEERLAGFRMLPPEKAEEFFFDLSADDQAELILSLAPGERRIWMRLLEPDDAADVVQAADEEDRATLLGLLDEATRREVTALLAYEEDEAGGLMSSRFARLRPDITVDEAISYLRRQALGKIEVETLYYIYVLDNAQRLLGILSLRELFGAPGNRLVRDVMNTDFVAVPEDMDQEAVARLFAEYDVVALPVINDEGRMVGIVTVDDIVDVVQEETTEDIQKYGGMEALEEPYLRIGFIDLMRKRAPWLSILFIGEMFTTFAMSRFEGKIEEAAFLASFVPLIISSGGNSGSQASTLVVRALTLDEIKLRDWWRVVRREFFAGALLGSILGALGILRVAVWQLISPIDYNGALAAGLGTAGMSATVFVSLLGVVLFGTIAGSTLPLLLRKLNFDPASASAPFVATLVDVMGVLIYFAAATALIL